MSIVSTLQGTGLTCVYSETRKGIAPPFIAYIGNGQDTFDADNTHYWRRNRYQIEYYFTNKNEANETAIEDALLAAGYLYDKSEDIFIQAENLYVIYYYV